MEKIKATYIGTGSKGIFGNFKTNCFDVILINGQEYTFIVKDDFNFLLEDTRTTIPIEFIFKNFDDIKRVKQRYYIVTKTILSETKLYVCYDWSECRIVTLTAIETEKAGHYDALCFNNEEFAKKALDVLSLLLSDYTLEIEIK